MDDQLGRDDGLDFISVLILGKEYLAYMLRYWWLILAGAALVGGIFVYRAYTTDKIFTAELTFMVNDDTGKGGADVGALLGQFGLGGGVASEYNLDKVVSLSRSRRIIHSALLDSVEISGVKDILANFIINQYDLHNEWKEIKHLDITKVKFTSAEIDSFAIEEKLALKILYGIVVGVKGKTGGLLMSNVNETTGILHLNAFTTHEELSLQLSNSIYQKLEKFYVDKSTEKQKSTFAIMTSKADSIKTVLRRVEYSLAMNVDRNRNVNFKKDLLEQQRLGRDAQVLTVMYGEALKNKEAAGFLLDKSTPFFQIIDRPILPLASDQPSKIRGLIIGVIIGGGVFVFLLMSNKIIKEVLVLLKAREKKVKT